MLLKALKTVLLTSIALAATNTFANNQTFSVGYAQTDVVDDLDVKGVNVQYRYEWQSPVSILASVSYQNGDDKYDYGFGYDVLDLDYYSALVGPAYRFNELVSVYALGGIAHAKIEYTEQDYDGSYYYKEKSNETTFAYGAGVIINPKPNLSFNVGYEGTKVDSVSLNGFNVGVGYRF